MDPSPQRLSQHLSGIAGSKWSFTLLPTQPLNQMKALWTYVQYCTVHTAEDQVLCSYRVELRCSHLESQRILSAGLGFSISPAGLEQRWLSATVIALPHSLFCWGLISGTTDSWEACSLRLLTILPNKSWQQTSSSTFLSPHSHGRSSIV